MKHIDVYTTFKFGHKFIPEMTPRLTADLLTDILEFPVNEVYLNHIFKHEPKTNYVVNALYDKGIQPKTIAEWLGVNKSSVSHHLNNPILAPYINPLLKMDIAKYDLQNT